MTTQDIQAATSLLAEHLQYTPLSLIDDIINSVNNLVYQGITSLENGLLSTPPERLGFSPVRRDSAAEPNVETEYPDCKQEIEEGLHKLETLLESTVDKNFDRFEIYVLRNILTVPNDLAGWIRLSHYASLSYPLTENAPTAESVQLLRRKAAASQTVTGKLLAEAARNEAIVAQLKALTHGAAPHTTPTAPAPAQDTPSFSFLNTSPNSKSLNISTEKASQLPLTTNTTFTLSQLPALRAILAELRPRLSTLRSGENSVSGARDEQRQERVDYIQQRTRQHLERNGMTDVDNATAVRGKAVDREEIEALEKVAATFESH